MARYGVAATTRASVYLYNTTADLDALADGLERVKHTFGVYVQACRRNHYTEGPPWTSCIATTSSITTRIPATRGISSTPASKADGVNPLCGDELHVELLVTDGVVEDVRYNGRGCAISQAAASMLSDASRAARSRTSSGWARRTCWTSSAFR